MLPIGSLLRCCNELFKPKEAGITRMLCCRYDNGRVYHWQWLVGRVCVHWGVGWVGGHWSSKSAWEKYKKSPPASHACIKRHVSACLGVSAGVRLPQLSEHFQATFSTVSLAAVLTFCPTPLPLTLFSEFPRLHLCISSCVLPISPSDCVTRVKRKKEDGDLLLHDRAPEVMADKRI